MESSVRESLVTCPHHLGGQGGELHVNPSVFNVFTREHSCVDKKYSQLGLNKLYSSFETIQDSLSISKYFESIM